MESKKLNATAVGAFLSAVALSMREAGGSKEGYLVRRLNLHLDSLAERDSPLADEDRAHLATIRAAFEAYRKDSQLSVH